MRSPTGALKKSLRREIDSQRFYSSSGELIARQKARTQVAKLESTLAGNRLKRATHELYASSGGANGKGIGRSSVLRANKVQRISESKRSYLGKLKKVVALRRKAARRLLVKRAVKRKVLKAKRLFK